MVKRKCLFVALMLTTILVMTSCGSSSINAGETSPAGQQVEKESIEKGNTGQTAETQSGADVMDTGITTEEESPTPSKIPDKTVIDETMIYDNGGITATITGISEDSYGKNVEISITNNSETDIS